MKEEELLGLDFEEEQEEDCVNTRAVQCNSDLKDIKDVAVSIRRNGDVNTSDRGNFRIENLGSALGSDTPHEEGISDTPLDVPLSPMRLTDGELEIDNDDEEVEEELEGKVVLENMMMMMVDQVGKQFPDKKQVFEF